MAHQTASISQRSPRSDGADTRARLLLAALQLFSERGYAQTPVRAIAEAAGTNVAAIAYHFGDKAGLYTATFHELLGSSQALIPHFTEPGLGIEEALRRYFEGFLEPLKHDDLVRQSLRLHMRELLEPTHVWPEVIERECRAPHLALARLLCRHLGVRRMDAEVHGLAFSIASLVMQMWTQRDTLEAVAPQLAHPAAIDAWTRRLTGYALAMVQSETLRRAAARPATRKKKATA
ncbi:TetR/AcrR family transcriptional regulator [Simplicispira lacusdiani]|uniref:TetR/AcrR family transcriptional regulator n=1 Tax=Simplicispira lacusdiani TaxID=2213010 RepID=UPI000E7124AC|nr:CerR family C-terminal domain-containing protein [Simplicispira lacusdiani]